MGAVSGRIRNSLRRGLLGGCLVCLPVLAQDEAIDSEVAAGGQREPGRVELSLDLNSFYSDNYYYEPDGENEVTGFVAEPRLLLSRAGSRLRGELRAAAELGTFDLPGDVDDYIDTTYGGSLEWQPALAHQFGLSASLAEDHDAFGVDRTENAAVRDRDLDEWRGVRSELRHRYERSGSRFGLETRVAGFDKTYRTNRAATRFLDYDQAQGQVTALYRISPKTSVLADAVLMDTDFEVATDRSGTDRRYRLGLRWQATAKTTGDVRVGRVERDFDLGRFEDFEAVDWQATLGWQPDARNTIGLQSGRRAVESYVNGVGFIDSRYHTLDWTRDWSTRLSSRAAIDFAQLDFYGLERTDDLFSVGLTASYRASRLLSLIGGAKLGSRDSSRAVLDYDRSSAFLGLRAAY